MNVHARFSALAAMAALTWASAPLAAQSAERVDLQGGSPALGAIGVVPTSLVDSLTAVAGMTDTSASSSAGAVRGPSAKSARVAAHAISSSRRGPPPVFQRRSSNRNAVALMIVGGAALVIGAVIGDDAGTLVMLGGAGIGLYGLYLFLT